MTLNDLSIVIPALNEADVIEGVLRSLQELRGLGVELILVDGGSSDKTLELAGPLVDKIITASRGRASQMNAGMGASRGEIVLFLHADTRLPPSGQMQKMLSGLEPDFGWGFFNVRLSGTELWCRIISAFMNVRSRLSNIATGDQALVATRTALQAIGGFPDIPLMEDIAISKNLKKCCGRAFHPGLCVETSSRRWRQNGIIKTIILMWWLRGLYVLGIAPATLHRIYYREN